MKRFCYQVVVLSRIIPDEEPAFSSAEGIKTIVDRLSKTKNDDVRALASDCIARLAHTRAGGVHNQFTYLSKKYVFIPINSEINPNKQSDYSNFNCYVT